MIWEETETALANIRTLVIQMCERKPGASAPKEQIKAWEEEMKPIRQRAVDIHYARIKINVQNLKERHDR